MSIEFHCQACGGRLRTPDGTEGREARCPQCEAVVPIPFESESLAVPSAFAPAFDSLDPVNPYAAPPSRSLEPAYAAAGNRLAVNSMLATAWKIFSRRPFLHVGALVLLALAALPAEWAAWKAENSDAEEARIAWLAFLPCLSLYIWILTGFVRLHVSAARGESPPWTCLFAGLVDFLAAIGTLMTMYAALILVLIGVLFAPMAIITAVDAPWLSFIPVLALIAVSTFLGLRLWAMPWLVVDGRANPLNGFARSFTVTRSRSRTTVIMLMATLGIMLATFLAPLVLLVPWGLSSIAAPFVLVALLITMPVIWLLWAVYYVHLADRPISVN